MRCPLKISRNPRPITITLEAKSSVHVDQDGSENYQEYLQRREDDETEDDGVEDEASNHRERDCSTEAARRQSRSVVSCRLCQCVCLREREWVRDSLMGGRGWPRAEYSGALQLFVVNGRQESGFCKVICSSCSFMFINSIWMFTY